MKAIRKSDGKVIEVEPQRFMECDGSMYAPSDLDFSVDEAKETEEATINGWMARDKNGDLVCCAGSKPFKEEKLPFWRVDYRNYIECIPNDLFPSVTWDSEPMEVEITIKPKKKLSTK